MNTLEVAHTGVVDDTPRACSSWSKVDDSPGVAHHGIADDHPKRSSPWRKTYDPLTESHPGVADDPPGGGSPCTVDDPQEEAHME
jgi:hypothetical protein